MKTVINISVDCNPRSKEGCPKAYIATWKGLSFTFTAHGKSPKAALTNLIRERYDLQG